MDGGKEAGVVKQLVWLISLGETALCSHPIAFSSYTDKESCSSCCQPKVDSTSQICEYQQEYVSPNVVCAPHRYRRPRQRAITAGLHWIAGRRLIDRMPRLPHFESLTHRINIITCTGMHSSGSLPQTFRPRTDTSPNRSVHNLTIIRRG